MGSSMRCCQSSAGNAFLSLHARREAANAPDITTSSWLSFTPKTEPYPSNSPESLTDFRLSGTSRRCFVCIGVILLLTGFTAIGGFRGHVHRCEIDITTGTRIHIFQVAAVIGRVNSPVDPGGVGFKTGL